VAGGLATPDLLGILGSTGLEKSPRLTLPRHPGPTLDPVHASHSARTLPHKLYDELAADNHGTIYAESPQQVEMLTFVRKVADQLSGDADSLRQATAYSGHTEAYPACLK
jgi:hypothetical protein